MRRLLSVILSLSMVGLSAGLEPYSAWAHFQAEAGAARAVVPGGASGAGLSGVPGTSLAAPLPVSVSLGAVLPLTPSVPSVRPVAVTPAAAQAIATPAAAPAAAAPAASAEPRLEAAKAGALAVPIAAASPTLVPVSSPKAAAQKAAGDLQVPAGGELSVEKDFAVGTLLFDGAVRRAAEAEAVSGAVAQGRSRPILAGPGMSFNAVGEEAAGRAAPEAPQQTAPLLEGRLDHRAYGVPMLIRAPRAAALAVHYALLAAVPIALAVGFGILPAAVGVAAVVTRAALTRPAKAADGAVPLSESELRYTRELLLRMRRGEALSAADQATLDERAAPFEQLLAWGEGTVEYLVGRMGLDPAAAPRVWLDESSHDLHWAASVGGRLDKSGAVYMGVGFLLRPLDRAVGVLSHELGHLFFGDKGWLRERLRMRGGLDGGFLTGMGAVGWATAAAALAHGLLHAALFAADPTLLLTGAVWAFVAVASAASGLIAGLAATRQEELRADHFSAWLSDPAWLGAYLSEEAARGRAPRSRLRRWAEHLLSTHPAWETRVERLAAYAAGRPAAAREAVLPVSDSLYGLSGEASAVVRGADESLGAALVERAAGAYDIRLYQGMDGALVVRAHPTGAARSDARPDAAFAGMLASVLAARFPGASVGETGARAHPVFETLGRSALGRGLLAELAAEPIAVRWETGWGADGPRGALDLSGPRPEVKLNAAVFWKASPKALAAVLAHELFHYKVWRRLQALGVPWLSSGGLEFERLAQGVGYRVFAELGGELADDLTGVSGAGAYAAGLKRWAGSASADDVEFLRDHGYSNFKSLAELRAHGAEALAAELGVDAAKAEAQVAGVQELLDAETRAETLWSVRHPFTFLAARFSRH